MSYIFYYIFDREVHLTAHVEYYGLKERSYTNTLAIAVRMVPALSPFHSLVPWSRLMYPGMSSVTVPRLSEGIRPRGPRIRPNFGVMTLIRAGVHSIVVGW